MKKITLLAVYVTIVVTLVGPATVLAADPAGIQPKSPEAIHQAHCARSLTISVLNASVTSAATRGFNVGSVAPQIVMRSVPDAAHKPKKWKPVSCKRFSITILSLTSPRAICY